MVPTSESTIKSLILNSQSHSAAIYALGKVVGEF